VTSEGVLFKAHSHALSGHEKEPTRCRTFWLIKMGCGASTANVAELEAQVKKAENSKRMAEDELKQLRDSTTKEIVRPYHATVCAQRVTFDPAGEAQGPDGWRRHVEGGFRAGTEAQGRRGGDQKAEGIAR
jgi:hypothetical protein